MFIHPISVNRLLSAHVIPSLAGLACDTGGNAMGPSALTQTSALALLQAARPSAGKRNVLSFLRSDVFSASSDRIQTALVNTFSGSKSLRETYTATFDATFDRLKKYVTMQAGVEGANTPEQSATTLRNAAHNALVDVIMTNRGSFPPEGFTIRTEYPGGAWGETEIRPVGQPRRATRRPSKPSIDFLRNKPQPIQSTRPLQAGAQLRS